MKIGRKYFEIEEEEVLTEVKTGDVEGDVGGVGDVGGADGGEECSVGNADEDSADGGTEEKKEIEPLEDAVVNEVKTTKRGRKAKGE